MPKAVLDVWELQIQEAWRGSPRQRGPRQRESWGGSLWWEALGSPALSSPTSFLVSWGPPNLSLP